MTERDSNGEPFFFVDKSLFVRDVLDDGCSVTLITRPRRFGKSLNMSMLSYFCCPTENLFEGLEISKFPNTMKRQGQYPTILLSFKDMKFTNLNDLIEDLSRLIIKCYDQFNYLATSEKLSVKQRSNFNEYLSAKVLTPMQLKWSLNELSECLELYHGQKVMILIDEYDTPIEVAYLNGYHKEAIAIFRNMYSECLKDNSSLYKGVLSGVTRIAKEHLFSGLNNFVVRGIEDQKYSQHFGFTEEEVQKLCPDHYKEMSQWYNGYLFGDDTIIYNPWSVLRFIENNYRFLPYWINTASNDLLKECLLLEHMTEIQALLNGGTVEFLLNPYLIYDNLKNSPNVFWNLAFISGYLTMAKPLVTGMDLLENKKDTFKIPNMEVQHFFQKIVLEWLSGQNDSSLLDKYNNSLIKGDVQELTPILKTLVTDIMSFRDTGSTSREAFYHAMCLTLVLPLKGRYTIKSNHESGLGYFDIDMYPKNPQKDPGIVIEVKTKEGAKAALSQIETLEYYQDILAQGATTVYQYGFAFGKKKVEILMKERKKEQVSY